MIMGRYHVTSTRARGRDELAARVQQALELPLGKSSDATVEGSFAWGEKGTGHS